MATVDHVSIRERLREHCIHLISASPVEAPKGRKLIGTPIKMASKITSLTVWLLAIDARPDWTDLAITDSLAEGAASSFYA